MSTQANSSGWWKPLVGGVLVLAGLSLATYWMFFRFYVPPGYMAILTSKSGKDQPREQILAKPGEKGVLEEPLAEGRHFRNPYYYEWEIIKAQQVPAGKVGIVTSKIGKDLPPGEFMADVGQKGSWKRVLGPGTYRLNPIAYTIEIVDAINIPIGYVGVLTSLSGAKAPEGGFAANGDKGVMKDILQPGLYYINPNAYKIDVLEIGLNQVSFTGRSGSQVITKQRMDTDNEAMDQLASNALQKQMVQRQDYLEKNVYSQQAANAPAAQSDWSGSSNSLSSRRAQAAPQVAKAKAPMTPSQQQTQTGGRAQQAPGQGGNMTTFGLTQFVEFPSRDGFEVLLDMTVEFELLPSEISWVFLHYGDLPAVVDKILMPQILSVSRLKGSSYKAQDFIMGEAREKFQKDLKDSLTQVLKEKHIVIHNSLIRHVDVPDDILQPIRQSSVAIEQNLTNISRQNTARKQAELNTVESLIEQNRQTVMQETEKLVAEIGAQKEASVATVRAQTELDVAKINRDRAEVQAEITRCLGGVKAQVTTLVEGEKANGNQLKVNALSNNGQSLAWMQFAELLNPNVNVQILHAGPGTLWTDLKNANLGDLGGAARLGDDAGKPAGKR